MRAKPESLEEEAAVPSHSSSFCGRRLRKIAGCRNSQSQLFPFALVAESRSRMKEATAADASSSFNEEGAYYGEPAIGIPATLQVEHGHDYGNYDGDIQPRMLFYSRWSTTLFQCCTDPSTCLLTCCCPCVVFGRIAEIVDRGRTPCILGASVYELVRIMTGCSCLYSAFYRSKLRAQYSLPENPAPDWAVHFLCEPCALAQEYTELRRRGYDLTIGWQGNLERERLAPTMPPVVVKPVLR